MATNRDVSDLIAFNAVSDAITEAIVRLLADDDEVRQAAADYIEAYTLYQEDEEESPAAVNDAERRLRRAIAPKIKDALVAHGEEWDLPDNADDLVDQFVDDLAFVEFFVDA